MADNSNKKKTVPLILVVLDGWGLAEPSRGNAITLADTPNMNRICKKYPYTELFAHGKFVGLPYTQEGNSEAGHMNMGAGRIVEQDAVRIGKSINTGLFFKNTAFVEAIRHSKKNKSKMHIMGMLSNGMSAHSDPDHFLALLEMMRNNGIKDVYLHLFTDGRDSPKYAALDLVKKIQKGFKNNEKIATVIGRFYAMDRKKTWDRTKMTYDALVLGDGKRAKSAEEAIENSYNRGDSDEFIEPHVIGSDYKSTRIDDGDSIIFFNLRSDRARQLSKTFVQDNFNEVNPNSFKRRRVVRDLLFVAMTDFGPDLDLILTAYPGFDIKNTLPACLDGHTQLYIAETEKYAHVTYFFNGGYDRKLDGEEYCMIKSPNVKFYDETPVMKSKELADKIISNLVKGDGKSGYKYDFTLLNFAAPDMIGHTGNLKAGIECCTAVDVCLGRIIDAYLSVGGTVLVTADHGNIEEMINLKTGEVDTEHSKNKVPFVIVNDRLRDRAKLVSEGSLRDIAPTVLNLFGLEKPLEMTGETLIRKK